MYVSVASVIEEKKKGGQGVAGRAEAGVRRSGLAHGRSTAETRMSVKGMPYSRFAADDLILRDELAIDRTLLANERTLMAYLRSGVALLIAGVSIIHFSSEGWFWLLGLVCLPAGMITGVIGVVRYRRMNKKIALVRNRSRTATSQTNETAKP